MLKYLGFEFVQILGSCSESLFFQMAKIKTLCRICAGTYLHPLSLKHSLACGASKTFEGFADSLTVVSELPELPAARILTHALCSLPPPSTLIPCHPNQLLEVHTHPRIFFSFLLPLTSGVSLQPFLFWQLQETDQLDSALRLSVSYGEV